MHQIGFLLQNLLFAEHVSGTIMPIIRSSRVIQMIAACVTLALVPQTGHTTHSSTPEQRPAYQSAKVPQAATICVTLELLMMGIMLPETC